MALTRMFVDYEPQKPTWTKAEANRALRKGTQENECRYSSDQSRSPTQLSDTFPSLGTGTNSRWYPSRTAGTVGICEPMIACRCSKLLGSKKQTRHLRSSLYNRCRACPFTAPALMMNSQSGAPCAVVSFAR